jgi:hypothetical protein
MSAYGVLKSLKWQTGKRNYLKRVARAVFSFSTFIQSFTLAVISVAVEIR